MRLGELHPDGTVHPLDVVTNYAQDPKRHGTRVAARNALRLLEHYTAARPLPPRLAEARKALRADPDYWQRERAAGVLVRLPERK